MGSICQQGNVPHQTAGARLTIGAGRLSSQQVESLLDQRSAAPPRRLPSRPVIDVDLHEPSGPRQHFLLRAHLIDRISADDFLAEERIPDAKLACDSATEIAGEQHCAENEVRGMTYSAVQASSSIPIPTIEPAGYPSSAVP